MNQRIFLVITTLFLLMALLWQRSLHTHYIYTRSELEKEKLVLSKQIKILEIEIQQLTTPAELYSYWKDNEENLAFIEVAQEKPSKTKVFKSEYKQKKSKSHMASLKRNTR